MSEVEISEQPVDEVELGAVCERELSDWITSYIHFNKGQESTERMHRWTAISVIAAALERKVFLDREKYLLFPNLYIFIVGASGIVRKSTSTAIGVNLLRKVPSIRIMPEALTKAALIENLHKSGKAFRSKGARHLQSAVFAYASEAKVFLDENFGSIQEVLTTFYDCQPQDWRDPWIYATRKDGELKIHGPCLNILAASTPQWLVKAIPPDQLEGGFASRIIFVVETSVPKPIAWPSNPPDAGHVKKKLLRDLIVMSSLTGPFTVTDEARKYSTEYYEEVIHPATVENTDARFNGYYGRKLDTILKLAMVSAVSRSNDLIMYVADIDKAIAWLDDLEGTMMNAFSLGGRNVLAPLMKTAYVKIKKAKRIEIQALYQLMWQDLARQELLTVIQELKALGKIHVEHQGRFQYMTPVLGVEDL